MALARVCVCVCAHNYFFSYCNEYDVTRVVSSVSDCRRFRSASSARLVVRSVDASSDNRCILECSPSSETSYARARFAAECNAVHLFFYVGASDRFFH